MHYNYYPSTCWTVPKWTSEVSFLGLKKEFAQFSQRSYPSKTDNGLFNLVTWKDPAKSRVTSNVDSIDVIVLDHDGKDATVTLDDAITRLSPRLDYIAYSTYSNGSERLAYRLLMPLSKPVTASQYTFIQRTIVRQFPPGAFDKQCCDAGHIYYLPCQSGAGQEYTWFRCSEGGAAIDVLPFQELQARQEAIADMQAHLQRPCKTSRNEAQTEERVKRALANIPADDYHTWSKVMLAIKRWKGDAGWEIFREWSQRSSKFRPEADRRAFLACKPRPHRPITIGSIIAMGEGKVGNVGDAPVERGPDAPRSGNGVEIRMADA